MKPCLTSDLCRIATSTLRLQKMIAFLTFWLAISSRSVSRLAQSSPFGQNMKRWVIVLAVVAGGAASMRSGSLRNWLTRRVISGGIVAEKNKVWRRGGSSLQIFSMSGMKPMSSMRSASSMTRISTPISMMRPRWK